MIFLKKFLFLFFKDTDFSEWSVWSDCIGGPCQMGNQQRTRTCLKQSLCNNEQIQERDCFVPCLNKNQSSSTSTNNESIYSNWTNWSACRTSDCTSIRTRQCLQKPCVDYLIESRPCEGNSCLSKDYC
jgi:hypothetical protein